MWNVFPCWLMLLVKTDKTSLSQMTSRDQTGDPTVTPFVRRLSQGKRPLLNSLTHCPETISLCREVDHLKLQQGVHYRSTIINGEQNMQLVLHIEYRTATIRDLHDNLGHMGQERTLSLLRDRFYRVLKNG